MQMQKLTAEFQLLNWQESATAGAKIIFAVSPEEMEQFKSLTRREGKRPGQRLMAVLVPINDDETPATDQSPRAADAEPRVAPVAQKRGGGFPGGRCGLAVRWCGDLHFQRWIQQKYPHAVDAAWHINPAWKDIDVAADAMKRVLRIGSRKELDTDETAGRLFDQHFRIPYAAAREKDGLDG